MRKLMALVALTTLVLAACGGSSSKSTTTTEASGGGSSTTAGAGGTQTTTGNSAIDELLAKQKQAVVKVTYKSDDGQVMTMAQDNGKFAWFQGDPPTSSIIETSDGVVSCDSLDSSPTCQSLPIGGGFVQTMLTGFFGAWGLVVQEGVKNLPGVTDHGTETIAGRKAQCISWDASKIAGVPTSDQGQLTSCIDSETGVMLRTTTVDSNGKTSEIVATKFTKPSASDFQAPVSPQTLPSLPNITLPGQ